MPSPLDSFIHQLVYIVAPLLLCSIVIGVTAAVIGVYGKRFVQFLRGLLRVRGSSRAMRVLIVEDNQDSREALKRYLTRRDFNVAAAGDLRTGIDFLNENRFDAIISDIVLPDGTGFTLLNEARRRGIRTLGIAISGYSYPSNRNKPGVTGFDYHLTKPVNFDDLRFLLERSRANEGDASTAKS
jgi:CheY-like chemotaxis protein